MKRIICAVMTLCMLLSVSALAENETAEQALETEITEEQTAQMPSELAAETEETVPETSEQKSELYGKKFYVTDQNGEKSVRFIYDVTDGEATITDIHVYGEKTDVVFPSEINGYPVRALDNVILPRNEMDRIKSVTFEEGIERLNRVFIYGCPNLESIYLADSITEITDSSFWRCEKLKELHLPENIKTADVHFGGSALTSVTVPDSLAEIPVDFVEGCKELTEVKMGSNVKVIGRGAFQNCSALAKIELPSSVTAIGMCAFAMSGIEKIKLPSGLSEIGEKAFYETPLTEINIPKSVKTIERHAFSGCGGLKKLTISDRTRVDQKAFSSCRALDDVTVDGEMKRDLFEALNRDTPYIQKYIDNYDGDFVIFAGCLAKYKGADKNPVIPDSVTEIGEQAFQESDIDTVTFPNTSIPEIPSFCFKGSKIKELTIPSTVGKVKEMAFYGCLELERVTIEDGVESVQDNAFINCYSLNKDYVNIGKKVRVSVNAFKQTPLDEEFMTNGGVSWRRGDDYVMEVPYKNARRNGFKEAQMFSDMANSEESALMQRLGIISGYEDGTFRPDNDVTRAEAVKILINTTGYSDEDIAEFAVDYASGSQEETIRECADYNPNHWANAYLQRGVEMGIISGFEDNTLRPDDNVTVEQLLTMLVNITGYGGYAKEDGGYPNGYIKQAKEAGITDNLNVADYSKNATRAETLICAFNAINAPVCVVTEEVRDWSGKLRPKYAVKNGTGANFRSLLTYNYGIAPVIAEVVSADENSVTVNITYAANFGGRSVTGKSRKEAVLKTDLAGSLEIGGEYKMYVKIVDIDEKDYELVCAARL